MAEFSIQKMQEVRKSKGMTYETLSQKTGIPKSTITKVFGGFQTNPGANFLAKMATALECSMDEFFVFEKEPDFSSLNNRSFLKFAEILAENPELKSLINSTKGLNKETVSTLAHLIVLLRTSK